MNQAATAKPGTMAAALWPALSLDASDEFEEVFEPNRYCPMELLGSFTLLMAGHGRCVSSSMMLGDREYAMWQLARAHAMADEPLHAVAARLFAYFDPARGRSAGLPS